MPSVQGIRNGTTVIRITLFVRCENAENPNGFKAVKTRNVTAGAVFSGLMLRSVAKQRVSKHEAARMLQQRGRPILRDAVLRTAPQDEAEKESECDLKKS